MEKEEIIPYMEVALDAFGPSRMMFGSDWPVARLAIEYGPWVEICRDFIATLSDHERVQSKGMLQPKFMD